VILFGELLVIAAGLIHGLNGIRVGFNSFGFGLNRQRETFIVLMIIALAGTAYFAVHMFGWA
jgi:succinate dehydrogenase / fumarate reductase cytochrome b subunit